MVRDSVTTANGVYRTPGRLVPAAPIPLPSWRTLLAPLVSAAACVMALLLPVVIFHCLIAPAYQLPPETSFVPVVDHLQDGVVVLLPASVLVLALSVARRVAPSWRGVRLRSKVLYVAVLLVVQSILTFGGEATVFFVRGGLQLFEPTWKSSTTGPDGRSAHVYRGGLGCGYDVYVSERYAITMKRQVHIDRRSCEEPLPTVRWNPSGAVDLVDRNGKPLESEATGWFLRWGGC